MDSKGWLRSRTPPPPDRLMKRMEAALGESNSLSPTEAFLSAGARILSELTNKNGGVERDTAIDLLAADAFITYALEAAAENCESLDSEARAIMTAVAKVPIN